MRADPLTTAIDDGVPLVVLSPHLDDAVLSCGALMLHAITRVPVTVATFFTEASPRPYTFSARRYLRQVRASDAEALYRARRAEDQAVLERMGVEWLHLGLTEGLFRRRNGRSSGGARLALPELDHVYPTYRLHLSTGRISAHDAGTLRRVREIVESLAAPQPRLLLAPTAVGGHADHLLVRTAAEASRKPVVYYSDFPYNQRHSVDIVFARRNALVETVWQRGLPAKAELVSAYRTQSDALFPGGAVPLVPEIYLKAHVPAAREAEVS
ncbi:MULTISPECIES: PIG-L deacetylase family protein [unclassified Streptomyces]|uniref:PIG-L deacetylase family protein n=1 Tax=unclassified Streptomyces TaxID=2593676 RepID=UPI003D8B0D0D